MKFEWPQLASIKFEFILKYKLFDNVDDRIVTPLILTIFNSLMLILIYQSCVESLVDSKVCL
jgi:hypothetical protein